MCGICGAFRPDGGPVDPVRVEKMRDTMVPRGPDGYGLEHGPGYAVGHRRLAIIDLSDSASQPMRNEDGSVVIVFNGEIYNFEELRPQLIERGHRFQSRGDSEVLVHGFEEWGIEGLLDRVRGMFALALLDLRRREIFLARDPLGKKPLFYQWQGGEFRFASSARALMLGDANSGDVSAAAIDDLLWNGSISGRRTIFSEVYKVLPGHFLTLQASGDPRERPFWQPSFFEAEEGTEVEEWCDRIEQTLRTAVQRRFVADVPVGVMLSGGVDSSLVTAMAAQTVGQVKTFSVANEDPAEDESAYAKAVAQQYGTEHHVLPVRSDVRADLPRLVAAMGEPLADESAANFFAIAQVARQSVTVVLTGDGGDETFGGYTAAWAAHLGDSARRWIPTCCRWPLGFGAPLLRRGPAYVRRLGTLLYMAAFPLEKTFGELWESDELIRNGLYTPDFTRSLRGHHPFDHNRHSLQGSERKQWADRIMKMHMETILPDDFLPKVDLSTMAASLEARCPFLDIDLVELAMKIPAKLRFTGRAPKGILRRVARRHLPAHTVDRKKKGFSVPVGMWFQRAWRDLVDEFILGPQVEDRGWFRRDMLQRVVSEHYEGGGHGDLLWHLLILELWVRLAVDGTLSATDVI